MTIKQTANYPQALWPSVDNHNQLTNYSLNFLDNSSFPQWLCWDASWGTVRFPPLFLPSFGFSHGAPESSSFIYWFWQMPVPAPTQQPYMNNAELVVWTVKGALTRIKPKKLLNWCMFWSSTYKGPFFMDPYGRDLTWQFASPQVGACTDFWQPRDIHAFSVPLGEAVATTTYKAREFNVLEWT